MLPRSTSSRCRHSPAVAAGDELSGPALAIAAGSHTGEDRHVGWSGRCWPAAGLTETALGCPVDWPEDEATCDAADPRRDSATAIRMNCSGKHAAMLVAASPGWSTTDDYLDPEHPLQRKVPPPSPGWRATPSRTTRSTAAGRRCSACR